MVKVTLDATKLKVINSILTALLLLQTFFRVAKNWHDGTPKAMLLLWLLYTIALATLNVFGEFRVVLQACVWLPLVLTRCGRAVIMIFLSLMMFAAEPVSAVLGVIVLLGAIFNIVVGWHDPPLNLEVTPSSKLPPQQADTEMPGLQQSPYHQKQP